MGSIRGYKIQVSNEEVNFLKAMHLPGSAVLCMVLKAAIELDIFEVMAAKAAAAAPDNDAHYLSASQIASSLPTSNPEAPVMLDRILRFLSSYSILNCKIVVDEDGFGKRFYSLAPICSNYIRNEDGVSIAPYLLTQFDKVFIETWYHLKDAVLEGGTPFNRAYGTHAFEYPSKDSRFNEVFNKGLYNLTRVTMNTILQVYNGFDGVEEVVDVGGGHGAALACIVSKYPTIRGINFDLPHVIQNAPACPGVEHIEGDMFESVPKGEVIFLKLVLHDWSDEECLKLLKNCRKALPESGGGKVIAVESILPEYPERDCVSNIDFAFDMFMMNYNPGGKERTHSELQTLAKQAGFIAMNPIARAFNYWIIEII